MEALSTFKSAGDALNALTAVMQAGIISTAEFMVDTCVEASLAYMNESAKFTQAKAYIIWQLDGTTSDDVFEQLMQVQLLSQGLDGVRWILMNYRIMFGMFVGMYP